MANNIPITDADDSRRVVKATDTGGVLTPHQNIDSVPGDPFGTNADAAIITNSAGSISGKLRGIIALLLSLLPASIGQKLKATSLAVVLASDHDPLDINELPAGENHIGSTGRAQVVITATPTINPAAYATGDVIGGKVTIASVARVTAGSGKIVAATLSDKAKQNVAIDVIFFDSDPSSSTFTDNAAVEIADADASKIIGTLSFVSGDYISFAGCSAAHKTAAIAFALASGNSLYAVFISRGAPTYASSSDLNLRLAIEQN